MKPTTYTPRLSPQFVARALNLTLPPAILSSSVQSFSSVITDSRKIEKDCLFVCLKGEKFDAHEFIPEALKRGAKGILCRRGTTIDNPAGAHLFFVEDTLDAFRKIAYHWRREFSFPVIAVAGSVGKTTTKEILTAVLTGKYTSVLKTQGSQNGFVGIPMTLLELRPSHEAAVVEVGIDEIDAMKAHMELVGATASVLTTIGPEHLEKLRDVATVAREEGFALSMVAQNGGLVAINLDDEWIRPHARTIRDGTKITYSLSDSQADLVAEYFPSEQKLEVRRTSDGSKARYEVPLAGAHNARNTLAAIALAVGIGLSPAEIQKGLRAFEPAGGRSEVKEIGQVHFVCDYYNANPTSTEAGLDLLSQIAKLSRSKHRFACLGDMLELGQEEEKFHRALADALSKHGVENVYLYGARMKWLADELQKRGYSGHFQHFDQHGSLSHALANEIRPGDAVLIKGSRGMKMEEVFKHLEQCLPKS